MKKQISVLIVCAFSIFLMMEGMNAKTPVETLFDTESTPPFYDFTQNVDGTYTAENGITYQELKHLEGRDPNAVCDGYYEVLTNNPDITYHDVSWSFLSSQSTDALDENDTIILWMGTVKK